MRLLGMYGATGTVASYTRDPAASARVRPLTPWLALSPRIPIVQESNEIQREVQCGRTAVAAERCEQMLQRLPPATPGEADVLELAKASENVQKFLEGFEIVKEIYVPGKLVNLAVRPA